MEESTKQPEQPRLVRDLMSVGVPTCALDTPVLELTRFLLAKELEGVVVLDEHGHGAGVVSRDDLVRAYAAGGDESLTAEDVMSAEVFQLPPDIPLTAAAQIMQDKGVRVAYMMHHAGGVSYPAAMLTFRHFLRHLAVESTAEIRDLGIKAERESPLATFLRRREEAKRRAGLHTE